MKEFKHFLQIFICSFSGIFGVVLCMAETDSELAFVGSKIIGVALVALCLYIYFKYLEKGV